jgi:hypothetical protein
MIAEIVVGLIAVVSLARDISLSAVSGIKVAGGLYIIVRGMDNIDKVVRTEETLRDSTLGKVWQIIFPDH